jgi:hypothetical protein
MNENQHEKIIVSLQEKLGYDFVTYFEEEGFLIDYLKVAPAIKGLLKRLVKNENLTKQILFQILSLTEHIDDFVYNGKCIYYDESTKNYIHFSPCELHSLDGWSALEDEILDIWEHSTINVKKDRDVCLKLLGSFHHLSFSNEIHGQIMNWYDNDVSFFYDLYKYYPIVGMHNVLLSAGYPSDPFCNDRSFYLQLLKIMNTRSADCSFPLKAFAYADKDLQCDLDVVRSILNYSPYPYFYLDQETQLKEVVLDCMKQHVDFLKNQLDSSLWQISDCPDDGFSGWKLNDKVKEVLERISSLNNPK